MTSLNSHSLSEPDSVGRGGRSVWQFLHALSLSTIRARLLIAFVTMVLIPALATGVAAGILGLQSVRQRLISQIELVAMFKETESKAWISSLQTDLNDVLAEEGTTLFLRTVLRASDITLYRGMRDELQRRFQLHISETGLFEELLLLDLQGQAVVSSDATQEDTIHSDQTYFQEGLKESSVQPPFYSSSLGRTAVFAVHPVVDEEGQVLGVLAGCANTARLNEIMGERTGLGETGKTYLVDLSHTLLTESRFGEEGTYVRTQGADAAIEDHSDGSGMYEDYRGERVIGVYHWLPEFQVALLAEQDQAEAFGGVYVMLGAIGGVAVVAVLVAVVASLFVTRSIATPLGELAETAAQITAGDLERVAKVERRDEIGALAQAFNSMTAQLRGLIGSLEQRVAERTADLERRSVHMEAAAQVAREAAAIRDVGQLLNATARLISDRFGFYHTGIFLLDEAREYAVLRAASSEGGQRMLARGHKLKVGAVGIVGYAAGMGEPRIALDVGADAVFFDNPDLPDTRSEMGLPLKVRERVIGVLDVQSAEQRAFSDEDVAILETMADQLALAIENARLLEESQRALRELETLYGRQAREAWRERATRQPAAYHYTGVGVDSAPPSLTVEMEALPLHRRPVVIQEEDGRQLIAPIRLRGQTLGSIVLRQDPEAEPWSPDEIALVEQVSIQVGLALENARLLEETRQRAEQERLIGDITTRVRASMDLESILQTAVRELGAALGTDRAFIRLGTGTRSNDK
ncbi:MAG: GAF domain-containing protein [Anaerolineae bacterium]